MYLQVEGLALLVRFFQLTDAVRYVLCGFIFTSADRATSEPDIAKINVRTKLRVTIVPAPTLLYTSTLTQASARLLLHLTSDPQLPVAHRPQWKCLLYTHIVRERPT